MHSTEWAHSKRHAPKAKSGLRAQLSRGFHLTGASLRVLAHDPHLLVLPFLALVFTGFVWFVVILTVVALGMAPAPGASGVLYQEVFVAYVITYFLSLYFMSAIVGAAAIRLDGRRPTVSDGVVSANQSFLQIVAWALVAATVGMLLRLTSLRSDEGGRFVSRILGTSWAVATLFVIPAMVLEGLGPIKALRRSRELLKEGWGTHPRGVLGTGLVFLLLFSFGLVPLLWGIVIEPGNLFGPVVALLYWLLLTSLWSVVHGIFVTTLYHYATDGEAAFGFTWQALNHPWVR